MNNHVNTSLPINLRENTFTDPGANGKISIKFRPTPHTKEAPSLSSTLTRLAKFTRNSNGKTLTPGHYTDLFNTWVNGNVALSHSTNTYTNPHRQENGRNHVTHQLLYSLMCMDGVLTLKASGHSFTLRDLKPILYRYLIEELSLIPTVQMEEETAQGVTAQESDKANNTIVTRDADQTIYSETGVDTPQLDDICSTEPTHQFPSVTNRWMPLPSIEIKDSQAFNTIIQTYNLPSFLYSENSAPNMMPFENFMFGKYDIVFKFVVNANKFHAGKVVASVKTDSYQIDTLRNDVASQLARPHVILDLSANNEGMLHVPFKYHRTFVRNASLSNSQYGSKAAQYASITISILSPLAVGLEAPKSMFIRPFYAIKKASFTGMSYKVPVAQMEDVAHVARVLDKTLKFIGKIPNMDKPYDETRVQQVVLRPRINFQSGKGASDCVPLRLDPMTQTTFYNDHQYPDDPEDVLQIAQIWGFAGAFNWNISATEGTELFTMPIEPTWRLRSNWSGVPTPLEYVSSMYQFWSGPLEVRLDFVSNSFHTGSIMISAEFGRTSNSAEQSGSTYTKVFHLGEQRSVNFTIPYIYDTVWRRTSTIGYCPLKSSLDANDRSAQLSVLRANSSSLKIRIINALVPVQTVTKEIKVLVFVRGAPTFTLHSPIMANMLNSEAGYSLENFPGQTAKEAANETTRNSLATNVREKGAIQVSHSWMKGKTPAIIRSSILTNKVSQSIPNPDNAHRTNDSHTLPHEPTIPLSVELAIIPRPDKPARYYWVNKDNERETYNPETLPNAKYTHIVLPSFAAGKDSYVWNTATSHKYRYDHKTRTFQMGNSWLDLPAYSQMDDGMEETVDATADFSIGCDRSNVQTIERHTNIKDILRRPICICNDITIPAFSQTTGIQVFSLPCMPPSHMMAYGEKENRVFSPLLGRSPHAHLLDLFRFWRGSQRYTIVAHRSTGAPIYASYVPHSGAMVTGDVTFLTADLLSATCSPSTMGFATEMCIPSVNPTMAVEVPYETEDNWTLMACENWERNFSWRDKGDYNSGHLLIWSKETFTADIWWSAGDDFTIKNFLGPPPVTAPFSKFMLSDNHPTPQMEDFQSKGIWSKASNFIRSATPGVLAATAMGIPVVGPPIAMAMGAVRANQVLDSLETTSHRANETLGTFNDVAVNLNDILGLIKSKIGSTMQVADNVYNTILNGIIDMFANMGNWNPKNIAMTFIRLIANLIGSPMFMLTGFIDKLTNLFRVSPRAQAEDSIEQISESFWTEQNVKEFFKISVGMIGALIGVVINNHPSASPSFIKRIISLPFNGHAVSHANGLFRFAESIFHIVKESVLWIISKISPETRIIKQLRMTSPIINEFVKETQVLNNECNKGAFLYPAFRMRYWVNIIRAYEIQKRLVGLPNNAVSTTLTHLCKDAIRQGKENMADLRCAPIKYEPFVVVIQGGAGIGKSTLVSDFAKKMLNAIGITKYAGDPVYARIAGTKHWNGYSDQPVVLYDDWMNILEPTIVSQVLNELYQLKSCATFIPEQAAIEDKKIKATPKLVILLCNDSHPNTALTQMVSCTDAVYRRRDLAVSAELKNAYIGVDPRTMPTEVQQNFGHLIFREDTGKDTASLSVKCLDYNDFVDYAVNRFQVYNQQENKNVRTRMEKLLSFFGTGMVNTRDPFEVFYRGMDEVTIGENLTLRSEILEEHIRQIADGMEAPLVEDEPINVLPNPWDIPDAQLSNWVKIPAALISMTAAIPIITSVVDRINAFIQQQYSNSLPEHTCCICMDQVPIAYICANSWDTVRDASLEGLHRYCHACYTHLSGLAAFKCGVCRDAGAPYRVVPHELYEATTALAKIYRASNYTSDVLVKFLQKLKATHGLAALAMFNGACMVVSGVYARNGSGGPKAILLNCYNTFVGVGAMAALGNSINKYCRSVNYNGNPTIATHMNRNIFPLPPVSDKIRAWNEKIINSPPTDLDQTRIYLDERTALVQEHLGDRASKFMDNISGIYYTSSCAKIDKFINKHNEKIMRGDDDIEMARRLKICKDRLIANAAASAQIDSDDEPSSSASMADAGPRPLRHFRQGPDPMEVFDYQCSPSQWPRTLMTNAICPHKCYAELPDYIEFKEGIYYLSTKEGNMPIPVGVCENNPDCPFFDPDSTAATLTKIFECRKRDWLSYIIKLEPSEQVEYIKKYIPKFAWPGWIIVEPTIVLNEPILQRDDWWSFAEVHPNLKTLLTCVAVGLGVIGVIKVTSSIAKYFLPASEIVPSGDATIRHFVPKTTKVLRPVIRAQSDFFDAIADRINNNYFTLIIRKSNGNERFMIGCGLKQRLSIIPKHYYKALCAGMAEEGTQLFMTKPNYPDQRIQISFDENDFHLSETADICLYQVPASWNMFKDIVKYMITDTELNGKLANTGTIIKPPLRNGGAATIIPIDIKAYERRKFIIDESGGYSSEHCLSYSYSQKGACGSIVCRDNSQHPIMAMHIAGIGEGINGTGYGVLLTAEMFAEFECEVSGQSREYEEPAFLLPVEKSSIHLPLDSVVTYVGTLPKSKVPFAPNKSRIQPSLIQDHLPWKTDKAPAILTPRDPRYTHNISPLIAGAAKHGYLTANFPTPWVEKVRDIRYQEFRKMKPLVMQATRLSVDEAITGIEDIDFYESLRLDTSAGWPLCTTSKTIKSDYCTIERNEYGKITKLDVDPIIRTQVEEETEKRKQGTVVFTLFVDTLKDEKKALTKLHKLGGTRVFCASPFAYTVAMRQNFLHMSAAYSSYRWTMKHAVGINIQGPETTELVSRLLSIGTNIVTIDYSNFGPGYNAVVANAAAANFKRWTLENVLDVNEPELDCLLEEGINSLHCLNQLVYRQVAGSPSGSPITVIINSEVNLLYLMTAWDQLVKVENKWQEFAEKTCIYVYGDDLIMSVHDDYIDRYNGRTITDFFAQYKIAATNASKEATIKEKETILEATFLKHSFRPHPTRPGQWIASLDESSVKDTPMWIRESLLLKEATRVNAEAGVRAAYGHGKDYFREYLSSINGALIDKKIEPILLNWDELDENFYGDPFA